MSKKFFFNFRNVWEEMLGKFEKNLVKLGKNV